jgi:soluble lytic murein transglycosylase
LRSIQKVQVLKTALFGSVFLLTAFIAVRGGASPRDRICEVDLAFHATPAMPACFPFEPRLASGSSTAPLASVRDALKKNDAHRALGLLEQLDDVYPEIRDVIALYRGKAAIATGDAALALESFEVASQSPTADIIVEARVGLARALVVLDPKAALPKVERLVADYPELPQTAQLLHALATQLETSSDTVAKAVELHRSVDLAWPWTAEARRSVERLGALASAGARVPKLTETERVDRTSRLVRLGSPDRGKEAVEQLLASPPKNPVERRRMHELAARVARNEGDFAAMARHEALASGMPVRNTHAPSEAEVRKILVGLRRGMPLKRLGGPALLQYAQTAGRLGAHEFVEAALDAAMGRALPPEVTFDLAMVAAGSNLDAKVEKLLRSISSRRDSIGRSARYHRARALERMGEIEAARRIYVEVTEESPEDYYALWSRQRLEDTQGLGIESVQVASSALILPPRAPAKKPNLTYPPFAEITLSREVAPGPRGESLHVIADKLRGVVSIHGEAFPQLPRAETLLRLGDVDGAQLELYETYVAYRAAVRRPIRRAGLVSVAEGMHRRYAPPFAAEHRARRELDTLSREIIADVAASIGDFGTAVGISDRYHADDRPRAYEKEILAAAERHGVDPNLLFAVMRVESVYQRRIVSHAGAIGLTQIMPRTGRLIAQARGMDDFTTADLLDPEVNLDFAAWYLSQLIARFDGHIPLAIASYNGGPHNMSAWIDAHAKTLPLDALLERIPFTETHRYVRRVLGHYEQYRVRQGEPMVALGLELPAPAQQAIRF